MPRPLLLGHRGAKKYAPENTLAAFDLALEHGCDGFEFDVRYTRDLKCVICHDPRYRRKTIRARTFDDLNLPNAEDVVRNYARKAYLDIELKVGGDAKPILMALRNAPRDRYVISSFVPQVLEEVHALDQTVPLGLICENPRQLKRWTSLPINAVMLHRELATSPLVEELHAVGKQVFVWTVNKEPEMRRTAQFGVDGIISDDTRLLVKALRPR